MTVNHVTEMFSWQTKFNLGLLKCIASISSSFISKLINSNVLCPSSELLTERNTLYCFSESIDIVKTPYKYHGPRLTILYSVFSYPVAQY